MNVLIIGSGGREHALAWKVARSPRVARVYVAPGNAGTAREASVVNLAIAAEDQDALIAFALREHIGLTIVGPEAPLAAGLADRMNAAGIPCLGPSATGARLEASKAFAKDFLARHAIPTARYRTFTDAASAQAYIRAEGAPIVVKADGLAAGKGVVVAQTVDEAVTAARGMLEGASHGSAGRSIVVEECLSGEEASYIVLASGTRYLPFASSQDHKTLRDGDTGPNTGGMGAYSPAPIVTPDIEARIRREVIEPALAGLAADGVDFRGFLYAGLMIDADGTPKVLEFNCRLGDPETQPLLMRLKSDLVVLALAAIEGRLDHVHAEWDERAALGVVLAAGGYPGVIETGKVITGLPEHPPHGGKVFHAGTALDAEDRVVTAGGRVLAVCALGATVAAAQEAAYALAGTIRFDGMQMRRDIGHRAVARERDTR